VTEPGTLSLGEKEILRPVIIYRVTREGEP
jgi:hypothetical protein